MRAKKKNIYSKFFQIQLLVTRLSGPRSTPTAAQKNLATPGIEPIIIIIIIIIMIIKF
jgi:hypothetical protein